MRKVQESNEQLTEKRLKFARIIGRINFPYGEFYLALMISKAKNISFPVGSIEFILNNKKYIIDSQTGDFITLSEAKIIEIENIRSYNNNTFKSNSR
ncbi:MAG: hypothetical protein JW974_03060 [Alphaproteobacteria bacterium]|nr:hypothetical protein [Alphaproteobacteria bacterium]MBN2674923.1 hypothetical protein [Alphaproteobacteria bacterium]